MDLFLVSFRKRITKRYHPAWGHREWNWGYDQLLVMASSEAEAGIIVQKHVVEEPIYKSRRKRKRKDLSREVEIREVRKLA